MGHARILSHPDSVGGGGSGLNPGNRPPPLPAKPKPEDRVTFTVEPVATPIPPAVPPGLQPMAPKIRAMEQRLTAGKHEDSWSRSPNLTGTGAIHVKSFHCKLTGESLDFLDKQINEWLDAHPQYEVKIVTSTVGEWTGKMKEPNLILQVWV